MTTINSPFQPLLPAPWAHCQLRAARTLPRPLVHLARSEAKLQLLTPSGGPEPGPTFAPCAPTSSSPFSAPFFFSAPFNPHFCSAHPTLPASPPLSPYTPILSTPFPSSLPQISDFLPQTRGSPSPRHQHRRGSLGFTPLPAGSVEAVSSPRCLHPELLLLNRIFIYFFGKSGHGKSRQRPREQSEEDALPASTAGGLQPCGDGVLRP